MQDSTDKQTVDLFQHEIRVRGRPVTGQAQTNADRQRAYRLRKKEQHKIVSSLRADSSLYVPRRFHDQEIARLNELLSLANQEIGELKHRLKVPAAFR